MKIAWNPELKEKNSIIITGISLKHTEISIRETRMWIPTIKAFSPHLDGIYPDSYRKSGSNKFKEINTVSKRIQRRSPKQPLFSLREVITQTCPYTCFMDGNISEMARENVQGMPGGDERYPNVRCLWDTIKGV